MDIEKFFIEKLYDDSNNEMKIIIDKLINNARLSSVDAIFLYEKAPLEVLAFLSNKKRKKLHGEKVFFNRNFHIEPTNVCLYNCKFCSYYRKTGQEGAWELEMHEVLEKVNFYADQPVTEVHITGGVHPKYNLEFYCKLFQNIKAIKPGIQIKALTVVEIEYLAELEKISIEETLKLLKSNGLDSLPGGGAEIFDAEVRKQICQDKTSGEIWLEIHKKAHELDILSNATMLYGHIEKYEHRVDHMNRLRELQDKTGGFQAFIPLKFKNKNNNLSSVHEIPLIEDLRNYAVARLFLDNILHLKAYWVMLGKEDTELALSFGVDDMDGTIENSTKIYSMAGAKDQSPSMSYDEIKKFIEKAGRIPVERDTFYHAI